MLNQDFNSILDLLQVFKNEQTCIDHLETIRWNGNVVSPFDHESKVYKCKNNRYRCKNTGKYFNVKTQTLFDSSKVPFRKWFVAIWLITGHKKGISSLQLSRDIDVTQKTAWFMLQRIRNCYGINEKIENPSEVDVTFVGGINKNRHKNKKITSAYGEGPREKAPVLAMVERNGSAKAVKIETPSIDHIIPEMGKVIKRNAIVYSDDFMGNKQLDRIWNHFTINHSKGRYAEGHIYTNTVEGFFSLLKRGIIGVYHFVSKKHLQKYLDEFSFRYSTRKYSECVRFNTMLMNTEHRLTYKELIK